MKSAEAFDRRVFGRRQTNIRASVRIGYQVVACTIKDLSEGGALLEFEEPVDLPSRVRLSWPDHPNEVICEVRHARRNTAGVQFTRPQTLSLKPAVTPADVFKTAAPATEDRSAVSANNLVAERRRGLRQHVAAPAASKVLAPSTAGTEPPRDLSALQASLQAAAVLIVAQREARRVPRPMAASQYAGAPAQPPLGAATLGLPLPLVLTRGACLATQAAELALARAVPRPLAAHAFGVAAGTIIERGSLPLPADFRAAADLLLSACDGHACAFGVWRRLANLPPRPLPARAYSHAAGTKVA